VPREPQDDFDAKIDRATYGRSSGVLGLRLFPNPKFDPSKWNAQAWWNDPNYFNDPKLERPYLVGMACSFCHLGPDPVHPPADPNEPEYADLSDYVGQHYLKVGEVFAHDLPANNFVKQLLMSNRPGTLDTSFIATDYLNNPGTMNGIYAVQGRLAVAVPEKVAGGALALQNLHLDAQGNEATPRVLKDGADSVGFNAALSRVYVNTQRTDSASLFIAFFKSQRANNFLGMICGLLVFTPYYQWQRDDGAGFIDISFANAASFSFVPSARDDGAIFRSVIAVPGTNVVTTTAVLSVATTLITLALEHRRC